MSPGWDLKTWVSSEAPQREESRESVRSCVSNIVCNLTIVRVILTMDQCSPSLAPAVSHAAGIHWTLVGSLQHCRPLPAPIDVGWAQADQTLNTWPGLRSLIHWYLLIFLAQLLITSYLLASTEGLFMCYNLLIWKRQFVAVRNKWWYIT